MKLFRFGNLDSIKIGCEIAGKKLDISSFGEDFNRHFFENEGLTRLAKWIKENEINLKEIDASETLFAPIALPSKLICIGLNYKGHAKEVGANIPAEPIVFFKSTTAICGPNEDVILPKGATKLDWEVELAFVIEKKASYVSEADAENYIAGYLLHNDYSERAFQLERGGQWVKGKSNDTFAPLGPYLVTKDEIADVHNLDLWLKVNGEVMQSGNTSDFIFNIPWIVSHLSSFMTLLPGDVISTGTPAGVGMGMKPPHYLKEGDIVELGIDGLGSSSQKVVRYIK